MKHFFQSKTFQKHMASLFPLDLFYFVFGFTGRATLLRIPRLLRAYHFEDLFERLDNAFKFPMTIRLTRTINIMLFLIHLTSCAYFTFSDYKVSISNNTYLKYVYIIKNHVVLVQWSKWLGSHVYIIYRVLVQVLLSMMVKVMLMLLVFMLDLKQLWVLEKILNLAKMIQELWSLWV